MLANKIKQIVWGARVGGGDRGCLNHQNSLNLKMTATGRTAANVSFLSQVFSRGRGRGGYHRRPRRRQLHGYSLAAAWGL